MGSSGSKATRSLRKTPPSWAGAKTPHPADPQPAAVPKSKPVASESKSPEIQKDSIDPQLLSNLNRLGPVHVDHHMRTMPVDETTTRMFKSRQKADDDAAHLRDVRNRTTAPSLQFILDELKSASSQRDIERLAAKHNFDVDKFVLLSRFVNSPSVDRKLTRKTVTEKGEELVNTTAVWITPRLQS
ncbi:hypothetical protein FISHEDRAFT_71353 [Fistulina hepatica ATCC 64428]|nr:hypothetical protein FISHEDRAFT_71353 [Fistulina hepatica ATCC 64428]